VAADGDLPQQFDVSVIYVPVTAHNDDDDDDDNEHEYTAEEDY